MYGNKNLRYLSCTLTRQHYKLTRRKSGGHRVSPVEILQFLIWYFFLQLLHFLWLSLLLLWFFFTARLHVGAKMSVINGIHAFMWRPACLLLGAYILFFSIYLLFFRRLFECIFVFVCAFCIVCMCRKCM